MLGSYVAIELQFTNQQMCLTLYNEQVISIRLNSEYKTLQEKAYFISLYSDNFGSLGCV